MSVVEAKRLCPKLIMLPVNFDLYQDYSEKFFGLLGEYVQEIEKGSIDERVNLFDNNQNHSDIVELFDLLTGVVLEKMPYAEIEHVGGSAVPGLLTAGDLDVEITVPTDKFDEALALCSKLALKRLKS